MKFSQADHIIKVSATILALLGIVGCKDREQSNETEAATTVRVGGILSLSGGAASYGSDANKGIQLAVKQLNAAGKRLRLEYMPRDDKSNKTEAEKLATGLIVSEHVHALIGPAISPSALGVSRIASERNVPMVATSATQDNITRDGDQDRPYAWRMCFSDRQQASMLAKFATATLRLKRGVIIYDKDISYSVALADEFGKNFMASAGTIISKENFSVKDTDYSALISRVALLDAEFLFIAGWDENIGPMFRQVERRWDKFKILGADGLPTPSFLELSGGNTLNAYAVSHFVTGDNADSRVRAFVDAYRAEYKTDPSPFAALGFDAMQVIYAAAEKAADVSGPAINRALGELGGLPLITTPALKWDAQRNPIKTGFVVQVRTDGIHPFALVAP